MTALPRNQNTDGYLASLDVRFAADLTKRAAAARLPRIYIAVGDAMQAAATVWLDEHGKQLDDEQRALWIRRIEELDGAAAELIFAPGHTAAQLVLIDSPSESVLRELDELSRAGLVRLDAAENLDGNDAVLAAEHNKAESMFATMTKNVLPVPMAREDDTTRTAATKAARARRRHREIPLPDEPT